MAPAARHLALLAAAMLLAGADAQGHMRSAGRRAGDASLLSVSAVIGTATVGPRGTPVASL
jgi:hypothetical protein